MKTKITSAVCATLVALAIGVTDANAAKAAKPEAPAPVVLTDVGNQLVQKYTSMLTGLRAELAKAVPAVDAAKQKELLAAISAKRSAENEVQSKKAEIEKVMKKPEGMLRQREEWVTKSAAAIATAQEQLKLAKDALAASNTPENAAAVKTAEESLAKEQANADTGAAELKTAKADYDTAKASVAELEAARAAAEAQVVAAVARIEAAVAAVGPEVASFLQSDAMDQKLISFVILTEATPTGLAAFAQQGPEQQALIDKLLSDTELQKQILVADGAAGGKYGEAMQIYANIRKASPKASEGLFQRLALATALEHAVPVRQSNPQSLENASEFVDPVKRYQHYEAAFLNGELDPGFKDLTVWDYRMVVDGDEPDETIAWGRQMLRNYRPDLVSNPDHRWRYVEAVKTEVKYGSQDVKNDLPSLQPYQNMIMNGGVCGRRAFFGRFILRAFGVPTTARPQPGHAALVHWTPKGWVINLGAGWGSGTTKTRYQKDTDFLAVTQARTQPSYMEVLRAHWTGDVVGETRQYGLGGKGEPSEFWNYWAVCRRQQVAHESEMKALAAVGTDIGEANESKEKDVLRAVEFTDADRKITLGADGVITIPASATSSPTASTNKVRFMPSSLGGLQLHHSRLGANEGFEYTIDAPAAGKYTLSARVVTTSDKQQLHVAVNDAEPTSIAVPFTIGMWDKLPPTEITLVQGKNVLKFSRPDEGIKGLTIKDFTLTPVK